MRRALGSLAAITAAGALVTAGGAFSIFGDSASSAAGFVNGTVKLAVTGQHPVTDIFALAGPCTQRYQSAANPTDALNLGTVNNTGCVSTFTVHNSGSLPFELSGTTLTDSNPVGLACLTSTIAPADIAATNPLLPGADRVLHISTLTTGDAAGCQALTDKVAAALVATESTVPLVNGSFLQGLNGWTSVDHGDGHWQQVLMTGPTGLLQNGYTVPSDPGQTAAAGTTQNGPGDHILYQDFSLPGKSSTSALGLDFRYENHSGSFVQAPSLSYSVPNQQMRIDVLKAGSAVATLDPTDILATVLTTPPGSPLVTPWTSVKLDLSKFAGQRVRIRFADVETNFFQTLDVTNVAVTHAPAQ